MRLTDWMLICFRRELKFKVTDKTFSKPPPKKTSTSSRFGVQIPNFRLLFLLWSSRATVFRDYIRTYLKTSLDLFASLYVPTTQRCSIIPEIINFGYFATLCHCWTTKKGSSICGTVSTQCARRRTRKIVKSSTVCRTHTMRKYIFNMVNLRVELVGVKKCS